MSQKSSFAGRSGPTGSGESVKDSFTAEQLAHVGLLWDPGNARAMGEEDAFPAGFEAVQGPELLHVHVKDLVFTDAGKPPLSSAIPIPAPT